MADPVDGVEDYDFTPGKTSNFDQSRKRRRDDGHSMSRMSCVSSVIALPPRRIPVRLGKQHRLAITRFIEESSSDQRTQEGGSTLRPGGGKWIQSLFVFLNREDYRVKIEDVKRWVKGKPWIISEALAFSSKRSATSPVVNGGGAIAPRSTADQHKLAKCQSISEAVIALRARLEAADMVEFSCHVQSLKPLINTITRIQKSALMGNIHQTGHQNIKQENDPPQQVAATSTSRSASAPKSRMDSVIWS